MSFLRTVPPYSHQAIVWADLLKHYGWTRVVMITSNDQDGRAVLNTFQNFAEELNSNGYMIEQSLVYKPGGDNITNLFTSIYEIQSRVFLLYASEDDAIEIYAEAAKYNLTGEGNVWFVTEQAISGKALRQAPLGVIGLHLINGTNELAHVTDAIHIVAKALQNFFSENTTLPPKTCQTSGKFWPSGPVFHRKLISTILNDGVTGRVSFDSHGDRESPSYVIVNVQKSANDQNMAVPVGLWEKSRLRVGSVVWPGGQVGKPPEGVSLSSRLQITTILTPPFVFVDPLNSDGTCSDEVNAVECAQYNSSDDWSMMCCSGFCIDLLVRLADNLNFTYDVHLVPDGFYGQMEITTTGRQNGKSGNTKKSWNGMVGELVDGVADMIVAPLTINNERAQYIDFSVPFKYQGLTILVKKKDHGSSFASFFQPFEMELWLLIGLAVHIVALILYVLDRFSPFGRFKTSQSNEDQDALTLSSAMWFSWGVLLNSGMGEGTPRSLSARVLGMVWAGFAMIMVASYTANLAAFLVLDRPESSITGINDPRLRNPSDSFKYATVTGSSVEQYFRRQVELSTMYQFMESYNYQNVTDAIEALRKNELDAFIWDSAVLDYEASSDCSLVTVGELFGRCGFGLGLQKGSPWTEKVSLQILSFHESGVMEGLDAQWISYKHCKLTDNQPATLGLSNMAGVFILVAGGIVMGIPLIFVEIFYKHHMETKEKQMELARMAAQRWRGTVQRRRTIRQTLLNRAQQARANLRSNTHSIPPKVVEAKESEIQTISQTQQADQIRVCDSPLLLPRKSSLKRNHLASQFEILEHTV
ncbi:glutamate receptor ionotropic, NMDA 1-like isoform X2 [Ptychodera flava]|uniref:glutamate receptor ionotropic, NMDA 1-like isoform X2 n=1 Tax=Ptychodera flava TaxID=63121 RepID=UPI00396A2931